MGKASPSFFSFVADLKVGEKRGLTDEPLPSKSHNSPGACGRWGEETLLPKASTKAGGVAGRTDNYLMRSLQLPPSQSC